MKSLKSFVNEKLIHETDFVQVVFRKATENDSAMAIGYVDKNSMLVYSITTDGREEVQVRKGTKYVSDAEGQSYSKKWDADNVPSKWASAVDELKKTYNDAQNDKPINEAKTTYAIENSHGGYITNFPDSGKDQYNTLYVDSIKDAEKAANDFVKYREMYSFDVHPDSWFTIWEKDANNPDNDEKVKVIKAKALLQKYK